MHLSTCCNTLGHPSSEDDPSRDLTPGARVTKRTSVDSGGSFTEIASKKPKLQGEQGGVICDPSHIVVPNFTI